jgi:hypothetical protein
MIEWLNNKVKDYPACREDFEGAGLLVRGGAGDEYGIVDKFSMADEVLRVLRELYPGMMAPPKEKRRTPALRPAIDIGSHLHSLGNQSMGAGASKRVKTEVFSHRVQTPAAYDYAPQHALPLPQTESDGMGYLGSYNSRDQDLDNGHVDEGADCKRPRERKLSARMREAAKFSKVLYLVTLYSDFNRALIFREFLSGAGSNG